MAKAFALKFTSSCAMPVHYYGLTDADVRIDGSMTEMDWCTEHIVEWIASEVLNGTLTVPGSSQDQATSSSHMEAAVPEPLPSQPALNLALWHEDAAKQDAPRV